MDFEEKVKIVAFARLLGVTGTDEEIADKYCEYYQAAVSTFSKPPKPAKVEIIPRTD